jgi:hypothetical protein
MERGHPGNTFATFPTHHFNFILDPSCIFSITPADPIFSLIEDLKNIEHSVYINFLFPTFLANQKEIEQFTKFNIGLKPIDRPIIPASIGLEESIQKDINEKYGESKEVSHALELLALSDSLQLDGIITESEILITPRYQMYQHHRIRVVPLPELADLTEIIAHGNSAFWSTTNPERRWNSDVYYVMAHWKCARLFRWFDVVKVKLPDKNLYDHLHSALLRRYPYILYSRDQIRFFELQREHYARRGLHQCFSMNIGYYTNAFYLMLWGMLEQLTIIAKYICNLSIIERYCGILTKNFWKEFKKKEPELTAFIKSQKIWDWINVMADMRHHAAHKGIKSPTEVVTETEDSQKSDGEILSILRDKYKILHNNLATKSYIEQIEPMLISVWRARHMKVIAPSMVAIQGKDGKTYMRDPVISLDYDLNMLNAVMDAFIVKLFKSI